MSDAQTPEDIGIYRDIPASAYHRWRAFSITNGLELLKSPGHYLHRVMNPLVPTAAMRLGTLVHLRLLEPQVFAGTVLYVPDHIPRDRRTKARKAWEEEQGLVFVPDVGYSTEEHWPLQYIIESDDARRIEGMYQSVVGRVCARELIQGAGEQELSLLWNDESGILCKGRLDKYHAESAVLVDIKTTQDASLTAFEKTICNRGYYIQAAHYLAGARACGLNIQHAVIVAIETEAPYGVGVYQLPERALRAGEAHRRELLEMLRKSLEKDEWPAYPDKVQTVSFPGWAWGSMERALGYY